MQRNHLSILLKWTLTLMIFFNLSAVKAQWVINEGFEGGIIPSTWTIIDQNNDGNKWKALQHSYAHSGSYMAYVECYNNNGNDWLITPQVAVQSGYVFKFWARAWYGTEKMYVKLSTTGTAVGNFNITLGSNTNLGSTYQEFTYDLSAYAGQNVYLAIQWVENTYAMIVDDVKVGLPPASDVGTLSIESPIQYNQLGAVIVPAATVKNFGTTNVTQDFPVTCKITNAQNTVVYNNTVTCTTDLTPNQTTPVSFPSWSPTDTGSYHVTVYTALIGDGNLVNDTVHSSTKIVLHYGTGGPDAMGYLWIDSDVTGGPTYNWIEISGSGSSVIMNGVSSFAGDDNFSEPVSLGFNFPFYGATRTQCYVDVNGEILLAPNNWYKAYPNSGWNTDGNPFNQNSALPGYTGMPALIAVFWDDLKVIQGTGDIYSQTFGTSPDTYTVIQWNNVKFVAGTGGTSTLCFEVILKENGDIVMQYKNVDNGQSGGTVPHNLGQSATIGIQNDDYSAGLSYLRENVQGSQYIGPEPPGNLPHNNLAIRFYPGEDHQIPLLTHSRAWNTFNNQIDLSVKIVDNSGVLYDSLYYNNGSGWQRMTHTSIESPNIYHYNLQNLTQGTTVSYYFAATDNSTYHNRAVLDTLEGESLSFKVLPTSGAKILLAMAGNKPGFEDYQNKEYPKYINALNAYGVSYDVYNWAAYDHYSIPSSYDAVVAYSNNTGITAKYDTLSKALMHFMDSGTTTNPKGVFMASDNMASMQNGLPNASALKKFFTAYIRGVYNVQPNPPIYGGPNGIAGPDTLGYSHGSIIGMSGSPVGTENVEIPVYSDNPDVIYNSTCPSWYANEVSNPTISSWGSFLFEDGPFNGNAYSKGNGCALWLDNLIYKSFFISFDLSQFTNDPDINLTIAQALDWMLPETFTISVSADPAAGGTVSGGGNYTVNSTATVTATSASNYSFVNWTENGVTVSLNPSYSFTVTSNRTLVAHFQLANYTVTTEAQPLGSGTTTGDGSFPVGSTVTVSATPSQNYDFVNWTENGVEVSTSEIYSFTLQGDRHLVANFNGNAIIYKVTTFADPVEGGSTYGDGYFTSGSIVTVNAIPAHNFEFKYWSENSDTVSVSSSYSFSVDTVRNLTAHFEIIEGISGKDKEDLLIYPNPAGDYVTIESTTGKTLDMTISDLKGIVIIHQGIKGKAVIPLNLSKGAYLIRINDDVRKLMIK
ncbi:MAG: choice-of-anchor J domain-containing protein [Bacteroidota bacterium]|nr:choice-of-anchor J domain-containing protein [Bacteroidota bacterium]